MHFDFPDFPIEGHNLAQSLLRQSKLVDFNRVLSLLLLVYVQFCGPRDGEGSLLRVKLRRAKPGGVFQTLMLALLTLTLALLTLTLALALGSGAVELLELEKFAGVLDESGGVLLLGEGGVELSVEEGGLEAVAVAAAALEG